MDKRYEHIQALKQKILQLIAHANQQESRLQELQQENEKLKYKLAKKGKTADQESATMDKHAIVGQLKAQPRFDQENLLSSYIKAIDQCIAFFEKTK